MKQKHRVLAWALAGALVLAGVPVRAEGSTVYVSGSGSGENSGTTEGSPLNSIYQAQELLPEGGTILVTSTIYIAGEREYSLQDGITLQAAEGLEGPVFEIAEGGELTLNHMVIVGNSSTLISNSGVLRMDDSVSLQVKDSGSVGCVYTAEGAATYLNDELVAGDSSAGKEEQSEAAETEAQEKDQETEEKQTEKESDSEETEGSAETDQKQPETAGTLETETKQPETAETSETETKQPETAGNTETEKKQPETAGSTETEKKQPETAGTSETETKQPETAGTSETEKKQPETAKTPETEKKQPETAGSAETDQKQPETETSVPIRAEAVETVKNAIVALSIHSREDVRSLLPVSQAYDGLTEAEKEAIPAEVRQLLESAKKMAAAYNHTQLGVSVYGNIPWYVQFQVKLTENGKKEENGQKVLVPYELNLWNMYANTSYSLPEGESVTVTMPVPDMEMDGEFTVFHYKTDGTVESIKPVINGNMMSFETSSFSPFTVAGSTVITGIGIGSVTPSDNSSGNGSGTSGNTGNGSSTGNSAGTGSDGTGTSSGSSTGGSTQTGGTSGNSTAGSSQTGSTSGGTGNYNAVAVNTGDPTDVIPAAVTGLAALLVIAGILIHKKKTKH